MGAVHMYAGLLFSEGHSDQTQDSDFHSEIPVSIGLCLTTRIVSPRNVNSLTGQTRVARLQVGRELWTRREVLTQICHPQGALPLSRTPQ